MIAKFKVGDSHRSIIPICGHNCVGGTWYAPVDVGSSEEVLKKAYPFLEWHKNPHEKSLELEAVEAKERAKQAGKFKKKEEASEKPVKEEKVVERKLSGKEFKALNRKEQEKLLDKLGVKHSSKDREADLIKKYLA